MLMLAAVTLALAPWHGTSFPTATPNAAKYKLAVRGAANQPVRLEAGGLPRGWVASFCTPTFCSPFRYEMTLDSRGAGWVEFQVIRTDDSAPKHAGVTVWAEGARVRLKI
ncbi:MAG TPA: hypothetical protein VKT72_13560 [Candidatus Baltobacteraceae bacterium]|nr:hypothetical protein [Candidatus Baltobacteraceae bacterium]